jgi:uncharacterized protein YciI
MPQYLYLLKPARLGMLTESTPEEDEIISRHFAYLTDLTQKGAMILVGRTLNEDASAFGIAIFEAQDESAARTIMEADPAVWSGLMRAVLYPSLVSPKYRG